MSMLLAGLMPDHVLLADGDMKAVIQIIVFILILAFSGISQLVKWLKKQQQQPPGPRPDAPAQRPAGQQELMNEVEEFLRRASQGGNKPPEPQPQAQQRSRQERGKKRSAAQSESAKQASRRTQRPAAQPRVDVVAAEVVDEPLARRHLAPGLQDHISQRNLEQRQGSIAEHEQQFSSKIESTFQHSVGGLSAQLGDSTVESATPAAPAGQEAPADSPAAEMLALLQSPAGIRQAVLLNEVLQRPTQRW
ncbi:MAG: hypothetical protein JSS27_21080 [Planctomycetes bacterium]|nr:hypothetical protein [Planctomycetota bacterium]